MEINIFLISVTELKDNFRIFFFRLTNEAFLDMRTTEDCELKGGG